MHVVDKILSVTAGGQIKALIVHQLAWTESMTTLRLAQSFNGECEHFAIHRALVKRRDGSVAVVTDAVERTLDGTGGSKALVYEATLGLADCGANVAFRGSLAARLPEGEFEWMEVLGDEVPGGLRSFTIVADSTRSIHFDGDGWNYRLIRFGDLSMHRWRCTKTTRAPLFVSTLQSYTEVASMVASEWDVGSPPSELIVLCKKISSQHTNLLIRLQTAFTWVHENIVENQSTLIGNVARPRSLSQTVESRNGNASQRLLVLKTMLGALGVACEPVLVSAGLVPAQFPQHAAALCAFDRLMAFCPELNVHIVPQLGPDAIGLIPSYYYSRRILHLTRHQNSPERLSPPPAESNHYYVDVTAHIRPDGGVEGVSYVTGNGPTRANLVLATRRCEGDTGKLIAKLALWSSDQPGYGHLHRRNTPNQLVVEGQFHIYPTERPLAELLTNIGLRVSEPSVLKALRDGAIGEEGQHLPTSFHERVSLKWSDTEVLPNHEWRHDISVGNSFLTTHLQWSDGEILFDREGVVYLEDLAPIREQVGFPGDLPTPPAPMEVSPYYHRACGLDFVSPVLIPVFERLDDVPDEPIQIGFGDVGSNFQNLNAAVVGKMTIEGDAIEVMHARLGRAKITRNKQILLDALDGPESQAAAAILCGPILTILLNQRGIHAFHASCIELSGKAIAFCGASGRGKSTMVASFVVNGWMPVSDDILAVDLSECVPMVWPGPRQSWLIEDSANALFPHVREISQRDIDGKAFVDYRDIWCSEPVELTDFIIIDEPSADGSISMSRVENDQAVEELLMRFRSPRFQFELVGEKALRDTCLALARGLRVWRLCRPFTYARVAEVVQYIESVTEARLPRKQMNTPAIAR